MPGRTELLCIRASIPQRRAQSNGLGARVGCESGCLVCAVCVSVPPVMTHTKISTHKMFYVIMRRCGARRDDGNRTAEDVRRQSPERLPIMTLTANSTPFHVWCDVFHNNDSIKPSNRLAVCTPQSTWTPCTFPIDVCRRRRFRLLPLLARALGRVNEKWLVGSQL